MNKQANIQKAIALMKSKGMSAEKALRAVYPDWDDAKIQKAAMTIRTMDKTASVMQVSSAMAELEKTAAVPLLGAAAGYLKGADSERGAEGAIKGAIGSGLGGLAGGLLAAPAAVALADKKKLDFIARMPQHPALHGSKISRMAALGPKSLAGLLLGVGGGSIAGYKALTKNVDKPKGKKKTSAAKMTFSPAMDKSPILKGKQSKLPDQIQAKILKGKMKKEQPVKDKVASPSLIGLQYASNAMYANHLRKVTGQEKTANIFMRMAGAPAVKNWALKGTGLGGLAGGGAEALRLFNLAKAGKTTAEVGKGATAAGLKADNAFLQAYHKAGGQGGSAKNVFEFIKKNPGKALELAGGQIGKGALAGAGIGAVGGAAAAKVGQNIAKKKMLDTAKKVAVPAAIGAGGYALLS